MKIKATNEQITIDGESERCIFIYRGGSSPLYVDCSERGQTSVPRLQLNNMYHHMSGSRLFERIKTAWFVFKWLRLPKEK